VSPEQRLRACSRRAVLGRTLSAAAAAGATAALAACGREGGATSGRQAGQVGSGTVDILWPTDARTQEFIEREWIPGFRAEHPTVQVQITAAGGGWAGLYEKIVVTNASGTPPTVARGKEYFTGDLGYQGILEDLDPWIKGQKDVTPDQYLPQIWGLGRWRNRAYALPLYTFVRPLYHNVDLFREAGLVDRSGKPLVPTTWQEFAERARVLSRPSAGQWGTQLIYGDPKDEGTTSAWMSYLRQAGGDYINAEATKYTFNSPAGVEALQFLVDLIQKDRAMRPPDVQAPPEGVRKLGMWNAVGNGIYNNYPKNMPELKYGLTVVPKNKNHGVVVRGQNLFLMKQAQFKEGGWAFLKWASRDTNSHAFTQVISLGPVKTANFQKDPYASDPEWQVNLDQFKVKENGFQPLFPGYTEGAEAVAEELHAAYVGQKTAKDALAEAERRASLLLKR
jgi:multiple sugar transport system substrate-binding protein